MASRRLPRSRHVSIELLVTVAATGALIIGEQWEAAAVTFLFNLGGYLEARTMARTRRVIGDLLDLAPARAIVIRNGAEQEIDATDIIPGETAIIKPGSRIPVDGVVQSGNSRVDESSITGESYPAQKASGTPVYAGTYNQTGLLRVTVERVGSDTTLARIIERVEEAQEAKAPTQRFMERFSRWYTPAIILLSAGVYVVTRDVEFALTVLVIGCPGALVISTPVSIVAGIGGAARHGILMKGGAHLEEAGRITAVAFDKTGTLTLGHPEVTSVVAMNHRDPLYWAAVAERGSEHPIAGAILRHADLPTGAPHADTVEALAGRGIRATIGRETILVGNAALMEDYNVQLPPADAAGETAAPKPNGTTVYVAGNTAADGSEFIGTITIADPLRPDAVTAVESLRAGGIKRIVMLTGDNQETAETVGAQTGITEVYAELLPEEKLEHIKQLGKEGNVVAMIGDGINDAPALAASHIGIALGAVGTDVAIETADIALMQNDLNLVARAIHRARKTLNNIRQNVVIAVVTVTALLAGVLLGEVHMAGGMLIHEASVMIVILNGMRLMRR